MAPPCSLPWINLQTTSDLLYNCCYQTELSSSRSWHSGHCWEYAEGREPLELVNFPEGVALRRSIASGGVLGACGGNRRCPRPSMDVYDGRRLDGQSPDYYSNYDRLRAEWEAGQDVLTAFPTNYSFGLGGNCNLGCPMCPSDRATPRDYPWMPLEVAEKFRVFLPYASEWSVSGGEPLLAPFTLLDTMLPPPAEREKSYINTNLCIGSGRVEQLSQRIGLFVVSLHALDQAMASYIQPGVDLALVLRNIRTVSQLSQVSVVTVVRACNLGQLRFFPDMLKQMGVRDWWVTPMVDYGRLDKSEFAMGPNVSQEQTERTEKILMDVKHHCEELGLPCVLMGVRGSGDG